MKKDKKAVLEGKSQIKGGVIWIGFFLVLIIGYFAFSYTSDDIPLGYGCYYEDAVLLKQYIDNTSYKGGGDCSKGCLFMDVYTEHITFMDCGHIDKVVWKNMTYFFANEKYRVDLNDGDKIRIKWCYINEDIGRRIRSIEKGE